MKANIKIPDGYEAVTHGLTKQNDIVLVQGPKFGWPRWEKITFAGAGTVLWAFMLVCRKKPSPHPPPKTEPMTENHKGNTTQ